MSARGGPYPDPIHIHSREHILWTRVNSNEATPGVVHPLHWDFYTVAEWAMRASAYDRGIYARREIEPPAQPDARWVGAFFGRVALSVDALREMYDRVPGTSADEFEQSMLGALRPDAPSRPTRRRYPAIWLRQTLLAERIAAAVERNFASFDTWWRRSVSSDLPTGLPGLRALWLEARRRLGEATRPHTSVSLWATEAYASLARICASADRPDLLIRLTGGYGDTEDDRISAALWDTAHGKQSLQQLVADHGYNGYFAGNLASRVWREDAGILEPVLESMAALGPDESPQALGLARAADRREAEQLLLRSVPRGHRARARIALARARRYSALRQLGKVTFWRAADVGRAASRAIGGELVRSGHLRDREDVFFLVGDEFIPELRPDLSQRVALRRAQRADYEAIEIPLTWTGNPEPIAGAPEPEVDLDDAVTGIGVSPGRVEGLARVVRDPLRDDPPRSGEILVCHSTDPSWIGLFQLSAALVIDVGGPMSHGAIVARELGVPCVINTRTGTRRIRSGERLRVDGAAGTVERIG